jgi:sulfur carrier protein ThiS adenylyltransferase
MHLDEILKFLETKTVGIAGCGGLGSNCAVALCRMNVGHLIIADFDKVEATNLTRQQYFPDQIGQSKAFALADNLYLINPKVKVTPRDVKLDAENIQAIFAGCDVIIEAFDKAEMKRMLIETVAAGFPETPLIVGNGMAGWGMNNNISARQVDENLYVCGDGVSEIAPDLPPLAPRVGIVANMQANIALSLLLKNHTKIEL